MSNLLIPFLKWVKGPITIAGGWLGTWLYTNVPGLHVFGGSAVSVGKWVDGVLVFGVSAATTWLAHDHAVNAFIEHYLGRVVNPAQPGPVLPAPAVIINNSHDQPTKVGG